MESGTFRTGPDGMPTRVDVRSEAAVAIAQSVAKGQALIDQIVGATVAAARCYDARPDNTYGEHERFELTLSDGRVVTFSSYGYDEIGVEVEIT